MESMLYIEAMDTTRLFPVVTAAVGVAVTNVGLGATSGAVERWATVAAGVALFGASALWYRRARRRADEVVVGERTEHVARRSGELAFRLSLALAALLFAAVAVGGVPVPVGEGLAALVLGMVVARVGLYELVRRRSA